MDKEKEKKPFDFSKIIEENEKKKKRVMEERDLNNFCVTLDWGLKKGKKISDK